MHFVCVCVCMSMHMFLYTHWSLWATDMFTFYIFYRFSMLGNKYFIRCQSIMIFSETQIENAPEIFGLFTFLKPFFLSPLHPKHSCSENKFKLFNVLINLAHCYLFLLDIVGQLWDILDLYVIR